MGERYTVVPDGAGCFEVFDNVEGHHIQGKRFHREIDALAWVAIYGKSSAGKDDLDLEAEMEAEGNNSLGSARKRLARPTQKEQIVLEALAGKVKCSNCAKEYHGSAHQKVGPVTFPPMPMHSLTVTRYIGYNTPKLTVDLTCNNCAHTGLYEFPDNPLIAAGVYEEIPF